jgi:hypothetical protein
VPQHQFDRRQRSSYGIHQSFDSAPTGPTPWMVRFIMFASERTSQIRQRYWSQSNSGQIPGSSDSYANKLQIKWRGGAATGGTRADPIVQNAQIPSVMADWPNRSGSSPGMQKKAVSRYGMDTRNPQLVNGRRPMYVPRYQGGQIRHYSSYPIGHPGEDCYAQDYLPTRFSTVPPMKIVRMHRYGTGMMAGGCQFGTRQTWGQGPDSLVISPVNMIPGMKSRQVISVRGMLSPKQGTGRERIPAIFTPSSIQ